MFDFSKITSSPRVYYYYYYLTVLYVCTVNFSHVPPHPFSSTALCLPLEPLEGPPSYFIIFYKWHTEVRISCLGAGEDLLTQAKAAHQWLHHWRNETPLPIATNCQQFPGKGWSLVPRPAPLPLMKCWLAQACTGILQVSTGAELLRAMVVLLL